jgi:HEAT repeat protein
MVFGLFSKERSLQRAMDRAANKHAQSPDRFAAMEKLRQDGSEDALHALCRRFGFNYDKTIEDEQEKQWVYETLCAAGGAALEPLRRYMRSAASVAYPLRVLEKIATTEQALALIDELLANEQPGYTRDPSRRIQIIDWLADYAAAPPAEVNRRVQPYLADYDENVRYAAIQAVAVRPTPSIEEPLCAALVREGEESKRIRLRIAEVLCEAKLDTGGYKGAILPLLDGLLAAYQLRNDKLVKKA